MQNVTIEKTNEEARSAKKIGLRLLLGSILILAISTPLFVSAIADYSRGIKALQYKQSDAVVEQMTEKYESFGVKKEVRLRFWIDGKKQQASCAPPANRVMKKGELTVLFYNPSNPAEATLTKDIDYDPIIVNGAFGLFGVCLGTFMLRKSFK